MARVTFDTFKNPLPSKVLGILNTFESNGFLKISNVTLAISGYYWVSSVPSVLWRCWLSGRKGIRPVKTEWWGAGVVICLERGADLHTAQLMPLPLTVSCSSKIQIGFTFLVPAHLGSPGKRAVKRVCVYWVSSYYCDSCFLVIVKSDVLWTSDRNSWLWLCPWIDSHITVNAKLFPQLGSRHGADLELGSVCCCSLLA